MRNINKIKLYINKNDKSIEVGKKLEDELIRNGFTLLEEDADLNISIGGDGSFLRMVKNNNFNSNTYYIGINSGTLGFLQEINIEDCLDFVKRLNNNDYKIEEICLQETKVITDQKEFSFNSLNEVVIRNSSLDLIEAKVFVDKEYLESFTGDGLLISTSTGSTAYNLCFGGSIVYNTLKTHSITPIAPLNNKAYKSLTNSIVLPEDKDIEIVPKIGYKDFYIQVDGRKEVINDVKKIEIKISDKTIKCLRMKDYHFIKIVNDKLLEK